MFSTDENIDYTQYFDINKEVRNIKLVSTHLQHQCIDILNVYFTYLRFNEEKEKWKFENLKCDFLLINKVS